MKVGNMIEEEHGLSFYEDNEESQMHTPKSICPECSFEKEKPKDSIITNLGVQSPVAEAEYELGGGLALARQHVTSHPGCYSVGGNIMGLYQRNNFADKEKEDC